MGIQVRRVSRRLLPAGGQHLADAVFLRNQIGEAVRSGSVGAARFLNDRLFAGDHGATLHSGALGMPEMSFEIATNLG